MSKSLIIATLIATLVLVSFISIDAYYRFDNDITICKDTDTCKEKQVEVVVKNVVIKNDNLDCSNEPARCKGLENVKLSSCYDIPDSEKRAVCIKKLEMTKGCLKEITTTCGEKVVIELESCYNIVETTKIEPSYKNLIVEKKPACYMMYNSIKVEVPCIN